MTSPDPFLAIVNATLRQSGAKQLEASDLGSNPDVRRLNELSESWARQVHIGGLTAIVRQLLSGDGSPALRHTVATVLTKNPDLFLQWPELTKLATSLRAVATTSHGKDPS